MSDGLAYAIVSPVRDEASYLAALSQCVLAQTLAPAEWVIVDNGSTDGTSELGAELASRHEFVKAVRIEGETSATRGGPVVRAFQSGLGTLAKPPDVVVKLDGDVSFEANFLERLIDKFTADDRLGIASGIRLEQKDGEWSHRNQTGTMVRAQVRAYRWACLEELLPLCERVGWDTVDQLKANLNGWRTQAFPDLTFRHHRREGERDGRRYWQVQGRAAYFVGYRPSYILLRSVYRAREDPRALMMLSGYVQGALSRDGRYGDPSVRSLLRDQQNPLRVRQRLRELRRNLA